VLKKKMPLLPEAVCSSIRNAHACLSQSVTCLCIIDYFIYFNTPTTPDESQLEKSPEAATKRKTMVIALLDDAMQVLVLALVHACSVNTSMYAVQSRRKPAP
jgi:hypothetical protein